MFQGRILIAKSVYAVFYEFDKFIWINYCYYCFIGLLLYKFNKLIMMFIGFQIMTRIIQIKKIHFEYPCFSLFKF